MALPSPEEVERTADDPGSLFKFYGFNQNSLASVLRRQAWLANPGSLNDPFDMFMGPTSEAEFESARQTVVRNNRGRTKPLTEEELAEGWARTRRALASVQKQLRQCGVCAMSATPYELLLWAHYADNHRGFCVQYERCEGNVLGKAQRVMYSKERPVSLLKTLAEEGSIPGLVKTVIATKAPCWEYEREWRLVYPISNRNTRFFEVCGPPIGTRIQAVLLGMRMDNNHVETVIHVFRASPEIEFYQMEMHPAKYELVPVKVEVDWESAELKKSRGSSRRRGRATNPASP